jgi:hypothetical protein
MSHIRISRQDGTGVVASVTVDPHDTPPASSLQAKIQALASFKSRQPDPNSQADLRALRASGSDT